MSSDNAIRRQPTPAHVDVAVLDLTCGGGGALSVERTLARLAGVQRVYVNPLTEMAYVDYDPGVTTVAELIAAVEHCGYRTVKAIATGGSRRRA